MIRSFVLALGLAVPFVACDGFKEAMSSHVDVVATAAGQELSVTRLGELLGQSQAPLRRDVVQTVADLWVTYQLIGQAAANGDSLDDPEVIDEAMWAAIAGQRSRMLYEKISVNWNKDVDTTAARQAYDDGQLLAARHILFNVPAGDTTQADADALRKANAARTTLTSANFATMADQLNQPGAAGPGGELGVFPLGAMVPEFQQAVLALKPGEISQPVRSQFGYHLIRRSTYDEVKDQFLAQYKQRAAAVGESTYVAGLESTGRIEVRPQAATALKAYAADPVAKRDDRTVIATSVLGNFTVERAAKWINGFPQPQTVLQQMQEAPDSVIPMFVKNLVRNDLILKQADSAGIQVDSADMAQMRKGFVTAVTTAWTGLNVAPNQLADSAKTESERERLAASRIENYVDRLILKDEAFVQVPASVAGALQDKYKWDINSSGVDRALERAGKIRAAADSAKMLSQPPTAVPMPGAQPPTPPDSAGR